MSMGNETRKEVSLTILPIINLTGDVQREILCNGLTIELLTQATRFHQFTIASGAPDSPAKGEFVVKGSMMKTGTLLKVTIQLVRATDAVVIWADRFEAEYDSFFEIMESMVREMISSVQIQINHHILLNVRTKEPSQLTAYEHWIIGMDELKKGTTHGDEVARSHFEESIHKDPTFSLGYSGMSLTYFNEWSCQLWDRWDVSRKGAYSWAKKAMELDSRNYVAAFILGRIYLYEAQYELAEEYLRRALALNSNDSEILAMTAMAFVYLGIPEEADEIFRKANALSPLHAGLYKSIGALIALENGNYEQCISLGASVGSPWVDFDAMLAAAYHYCGNDAKRDEFWTRFMKEFQVKIAKTDHVPEAQEGLQWIINVSPYKNDTKLRPFWEFVAGRKLSIHDRSFEKTSTPTFPNEFLKKGDQWRVSFQQNSFTIPEVKGFYDLAKLLSTPEKEFHCTALMGAAIAQKGEMLFDEKAQKNYRKRILELKQEMELSEVNNDFGKAAILHEEYEELVHHLTTSLGLRGDVRKSNDTVEKARSAVTWRIRHAIQRIEKYDTVLAKHLSNSVQTGIFCKYSPEKTITWSV